MFSIGPLVSTEFCSAIGFLENNVIVPRTEFPDHQLYFAEVPAIILFQVGATLEVISNELKNILTFQRSII